jgi:hypothetical protein
MTYKEYRHTTNNKQQNKSQFDHNSNNHKINNVNSCDITMEYINLLLEKQNFILSKIDHVDFVMSKILKDNDKIKKYAELLGIKQHRYLTS